MQITEEEVITMKDACSFMNAFDRARHSAQKLVTALSSLPSKRTLVIVDMQEKFMGSYGNEKSIIPAINSLIKYARQHRWPIIVVEYDMSGETIEEIRNALEGYYHQETVSKTNNDGGKEVMECINDHSVWSTNLIICGIYGNACVPSTVAGLFRNSDLVEVDVITDAVYEKYNSLTPRIENREQLEGEIMVEDVLSLVTAIPSCR